MHTNGISQKQDINIDDTLQDFAALQISLNDVEKRVYVAGHGPAVIGMTAQRGHATSD